MKKLLITALFLPFMATAQETETKDLESGKFELGLRSTMSAFGDGGFVSTGVGGQFRLRFGSRLNSEWFADYITADLGGLGKRTDAHIGWSVMAYPFAYEVKKGAWLPYIMAGHCFDYTRIEQNSGSPGNQNLFLPDPERWSSAIQMGAGLHFYPAQNFNISLAAQYMIHLGNDVEAQVIDDPFYPGRDYLLIQEGDLGLEGHLFISLSANVYIADLWGRKKQ